MTEERWRRKAAATNAQDETRNTLVDGLVESLAGEIEERGPKKGEHEGAEKIAGRERAHDFGAESEEIGAPGQAQHRSHPMGNAIGDFRVLEERDDDAE